MTKQEAAAYLNVSIRAIERYTARGRLSVHYSRGKRGNVAIYNDAELQSLKAEMGQALAVHKPAIARNSPTPATSTGKADTPDTIKTPTGSGVSDILAIAAPAITQAIREGLAGITDRLNSNIERLVSATEASTNNHGPAPLVDLAFKLTLSLAEASALSGLPEAALAASIKKGKLKTVKIEKETRIKRAVLEKFINKL